SAYVDTDGRVFECGGALADEVMRFAVHEACAEREGKPAPRKGQPLDFTVCANLSKEDFDAVCETSFTCVSDQECDDGDFCTGEERCQPGDDSSDSYGCIQFSEYPCSDAEVCDSGIERCLVVCEDADGDGSTSAACGGDDCDDSDSAVYPGQVELCDEIDDDCDPMTIGVRDIDRDGAIDAMCSNPDGAGGTNRGTDCDDENPTVRIGQVEVCNSVDDDCDGEIDEDVMITEVYVDADGDGFGTGNPMLVCSSVYGLSIHSGDCDDTNPQLFPGSIRCTGGPNSPGAYELCMAGTWVPGQCELQRTCYAQPGGFGVCTP
ncbi:MAG: putative metal-binding motif-containing protein, partial [Myxococcales bacterium]|nr:putative metal-binding motif-containing protein [Myxococcales bacterium]